MSSSQRTAMWLVLLAACCQAVTINKLRLPDSEDNYCEGDADDRRGATETPLVVQGTATFLSSAEAARMRRRGLPPPSPSDTVRTAYRAEGDPTEPSHWREPGFYSAPGGDRKSYIYSNEVVEDKDYLPVYHTMPDNKRCMDRECRNEEGNGPRSPVRFGYDANAPTSNRVTPSYPGRGPAWEDQGGSGMRTDWGSRRNPFIITASPPGRFRGDGPKRDFQRPFPDSEAGRYPGGERQQWDRERNYDSRRGDSNERPWDPQRSRNQDNFGRPGGGNSVWHNGRGIAHIDRYQGYQGSRGNRDYDARGQESRDSSRYPGNRGFTRDDNPGRSRGSGEGFSRYPIPGHGGEAPDETSGGRRWARGERRGRECVYSLDGRDYNEIDCDEYEAIVGFYGRWRRGG